ncbi:MAG TPA: M1 family metallopeptidase [Anaerolineales bacterium]|nr:M1 family metallopeptidase [Anaerolineales bacterium]
MPALLWSPFHRDNRPVIQTVVLLAFLVAACTANSRLPDASPPHTVTPEILPAETNNTPTSPSGIQPTPAGAAATVDSISQPTPTTSAPVPLPHYTLTATLNYAAHFLQVDERIDYTNSSADTLTELVLMVDAVYFPGTFTLKSLTWVDSEANPEVTWDNAILHLQLPQPLPPGEQVSLSLSYTLNLPSPVPSEQVRPIPFGYTARQTNLVDWYPFIAPYISGEGWIANQAGFFGEHLAYAVSDFEISIRLEDALTGLIVAASSPAEEVDGWLHYQMEKARSFAWSVSHDYIVAATQVGETTVTSYTFPVHAAAGETVLQATADALTLFSELFGPYPRRTLSVVEADFLDGMEYDGLYFLSKGFYNLYQGTPGEYLVAISAHETAHMWWYALVGNDQAMEPWLDEALCTYSELLFYERYHPEAIGWWWAYRINYYEPRGWVNGSIYNSAGYRAYREAVYLNGAVFLDRLRSEIGPDVFMRFLNAYATQYAYQIATTGNFFSLLKEFSNKDLSDLQSQFFQ